MNYKGYLKTKQEYETLKNVLQRNILLEKEYDRRALARLTTKAQNFMLIENSLYLISHDGNDKLVIASDNVVTQRQLAMQVHSTAHVGMNKTYEVCNQLYFTIPRAVIIDVIASCYVCSLVQPLKTKDKMVHIRSVACNQKWQIDLVSVHELTSLNNGFSWLIVIVNVFYKYCFTRHLTNKSASLYQPIC